METIILGAGITGLSAGYSKGLTIYEMKDRPGGICASYYLGLDHKRHFCRNNENTYRFEIGGGHWIFGANNQILDFIHKFVSTKKYERKSAVYFPDLGRYVPYPLQNSLSYLPKDISQKALKEIKENMKYNNNQILTMSDWLEVNFGKTLCELFFFPFHQLYTDGLYKEIAPQDKFKTPVNFDLILKGAENKTPQVGYNTNFIYPEKGLDELINKMSQKCKINYNKKVVKINLHNNEIFFEDGSIKKYKKVISTLPLNKIVAMAGIETDKKSFPFTSVLVVNIGARKGIKCPDYHWIYIPQSKAGFHRVGFYSNVDSSFLPAVSKDDRISIYVEKAFKYGNKPDNHKINKLRDEIVKELQEWKFISEVEVVDCTWVEDAYTWEYPNSDIKEKSLETLRKHNIIQTGRYGKWKFQGIADSILDGIKVR